MLPDVDFLRFTDVDTGPVADTSVTADSGEDKSENNSEVDINFVMKSTFAVTIVFFHHC